MENEIHLKRAQILLGQGRYADAEKELLLALAADPNNAGIFHDLSICRTHFKDFTKALEYIERALSLEPDNPNHLYSFSRTLFLSGKNKEAKAKILEAMAIYPWASEYYNLIGSIEFDETNFEASLKFANQGLEIDPENIHLLNLRSSSLVKLNRKDEAFNTIKDALHFDPENSYTHANLGWATLEKGKAKDALSHFRNALKLDPNNPWAKKGMVEAMKGRYWVYALFLKYTFWMSNHGKNYQWVVVIAFFVASKVLGRLHPVLMVLFALIAVLTWIMNPLSNLFLKLNPYGRYALTKNESTTADLVGVSILVFLVGLSLLFTLGNDGSLALTVFGITMLIPLSSMLLPYKRSAQKLLMLYTGVMAVLGGAAIATLFMGIDVPVLYSSYLILLFFYQFLANYLIMK